MPGQHLELKRALRAARSIRGFESDQELALAAGVHLQTLQNWMYGKTTPRPSELSKVAAALEKPLDYFMAIYEGREPEPPPLMQRLEELTLAIRDLVAEIREDRERAQGEARGRAAAEALRQSSDSESRATPRALRETTG
jgi:transcriptional regulator with XRE-family HTH domain